MYVLRFKWWFICAALQNTLTNQNHIKNKLIGHDLLFKNGRRFNNFDYKYNDWDDKESQKVLLDYNLEVTFKDDGNQLHNFDIPAWNPGGTTRNETRTKTTPMLFVTPTTPKAPESITTTEPTAVDTTLNEAKVTASQTTLNEAKITASQTTLNEAKITASQTTLNEATVTASQMTIKPATRTASQMTIKPATRTASQITLNQATVTSETSLKATITETTPTFIETARVESTTTTTTMSLPDESMERRINETNIIKPPTVVPSSSETEVTTPNPYEAPMNPTTFPPLPSSKTELIMTFPPSRSTEPELNTYSYLIPTDYSIRYPPDMTFPAFGKSPTSPDPISMMFTRNLTTPSTTEGDMVKEAHHEMEEKKAGYFTTFLLEVSKVIAMKNKTDASELFRALEREVNSLEYKRQLSGFGKSTVVWFQMIVRTMNGVPTDVIQSQATLMYYLLTNRRVTMSPEVVYLLDLADKIYLKAEGEAILDVLQDIKDYPATTKSSSEIANELMFHVVINPFKRLYGTPQEKYLVQRLEELVVSKYLHGIGIQRRKGTPIVQYLLLPCQALDNQSTNAKRVRRYYNFDYDFHDWDNDTQIELDYTLDLNVGESYNEPKPWNVTITEQTEITTPDVLVNTSANTVNAIETTTNKTTSRDKIVTLNPEPKNVTVTNNPFNREPINVTKVVDPVQGPEATADQIVNATMTATEIMTFPNIYETWSQRTLNTLLETDMANHSTIPMPTSGIVLEAHGEMTAKGTGYLSTFLLEAFKVMAAKNTSDAAKLFAALEAEVMELDSADRFHGFGKSTIAALIMFVKLIKGVEPHIVQKQAAKGNHLLSNRTANLPGEVVIVLDLADDVYKYKEGERILAVLEDIDKFPNTVKSDREIAREVMDAVVLAPFMRIYGSAQEKFLVKKLEQAIVKDFFKGIPAKRSRGDSTIRSTFKRRKHLKTSPKQNEIKLVTLPISKYTTSKNNKHVNNLKHGMRKGKRKISKHWNTTNRGTKESRTTTEKPTTLRKKQKNMIKKGIKKKLSRHKIRKANNLFIKTINIKSNKHSKKKKYKNLRNREEDKEYNNLLLNKHATELEMEKFQVPKNIREQSYSTDEAEEKFKANIDDAFFHANEPIFRNRESRDERNLDLEKNHETSSFSDEESVLKSKIYKAFGYGNNFAKVVKSRLK